MNVFDLREKLVSDYKDYTQSFIKIDDSRISKFVERSLDGGKFWPEPLIQLNPTFCPGGTIDDLVKQGLLHKKCGDIFRINKSDRDRVGKQLLLHEHQREAIIKASQGQSYVLTSGTGSGKSLAYIVPIVNHILQKGPGDGIKAIIVYPMNALANSQDEELKKFIEYDQEGKPSVRFARYTGQENNEMRENIRKSPPDVLLTNYMMLELLLTRAEDRSIVRAAKGLQFIVFDELHTYRGRQGADVALLIRRCRDAFEGQSLIHIGTSATMASNGTSDDQRREVAKVAQLLFGVPFKPSQIVSEALQRATPEIEVTKETITVLKETISTRKEPPSDYESFRKHPLVSWIESTFGVRKEQETGHFVRQQPQRLKGGPINNQPSASDILADLTGEEANNCAAVLQKWLLCGSSLRRGESMRFPIFAFRLHQFFTRGDTVWTTIEPEAERHLELTKKIAKPGETNKPMYPLVFCRNCGVAYYRVRIMKAEHGERLLPRETGREENDDGDATDAYLYISKTSPWPRNDLEIRDRIPDDFKETTAQGIERIRPEARGDIPRAVFVDTSGKLTTEGNGLDAALIQKKFLFCLEPRCSIAYTRSQRSERNKLVTLGVDSRSTATTILSVRSLIELQHDRELEQRARKLLSFTDNRQDASQQSGHFNDFVQVALLRSALYCSVKKASSPSGLHHGDLSQAVFNSMNLEFSEYAAYPDVRGPARQATHDALRRVIEYFLYRDLERGWRVTAPNLEDCGLLNFGYEGLHGTQGTEGLLDDVDLWESGLFIDKPGGGKQGVETPNALRTAPSEIREEMLSVLLTLMRRSLAVNVDVLNPKKQHEFVEKVKWRLLEGTSWHLDDERELTKGVVVFTRPGSQDDRHRFPITSYGSYGRYIKRTLRKVTAHDIHLTRTQVDEIIQFLFLSLKRYGLVEQIRDKKGGSDMGYQLNADALRWLPGDGTIRPTDPTRLLDVGKIPPKSNRYFVDCYKKFIDLRCTLESREHTAQVALEDREKREERFRSGDLPLLFCSPTMELGVDIAQLHLVNLRNVPPTPANYAQRSGRAGRSGQPALVFTYCAGRSPHDQYFYRDPAKMVAGSVTPPRIDIRNRDLVRSHVYAIWMEVAKPDLGRTLKSVLDLSPDNGQLPLPVKSELLQDLRNPVYRAKSRHKASVLIQSIKDELDTTSWFHERWLDEVFEQLERMFESACNRWRTLYKATFKQRELHHAIIGDHSRPESERKHSRRLRMQAESQIRLLTEADGVYEGDFYSYRYFATEGFLPGYNFPRLPISAYVPGRRQLGGRGEFVSRPRFIAISEFGPRALVYHEGARYRVYKVNLDFGPDNIESAHNLPTMTMKRCTGCGYAHMAHGMNNLTEICDRCSETLDGCARIDQLIQLQNVSLKLEQRITCDEEERFRYGYKLVTAYRFPDTGGRLDRNDAEIVSDDRVLMKLSYGDATDLYRINLGWTSRGSNQSPGFNLDLERGYWSKNQTNEVDHDDAMSMVRFRRIIPYVKDTKNALVMQFDSPLSGPAMAGIQAAFKQAIQQHFQLEPRELSCEPMPTPGDRKEILFYESSEGGAGVLRQLPEDSSIMPKLAMRALEICHYDPDTLEDRGAEICGKACYECLLDYTNQPDHKNLDRNLIRDLLADLAGATCRSAGGTGLRAERLKTLHDCCDSQLERRWLDTVESLNLRLPSDAQFRIPGHFAQADFYYSMGNVVVFIDGPHHDQPDQLLKDEKNTHDLMEMGYIVIRFHHKEEWTATFSRHTDVFGTADT